MRMALIGTGLIGASAVWAMKKADVIESVAAFDLNDESVETALIKGIADRKAQNIGQAVKGADCVMVAVPVLAIGKVFEQMAPFLGERTLITDVGSVRVTVIEAARKALGPAFENYAPVHPIAGGEMPGVEHADASLFEGARAISTPAQGMHERTVRFWEEAWKTCGAEVMRMRPEEHDDVFASVSHLPHILSYAMVDSILSAGESQKKLGFAGAGFRDFTRIAASSPEMWIDICLANKEAILASLDVFERDLAMMRASLEAGDGASLKRVFARAAQTRRAIAPALSKLKVAHK